MFPVWLLFIFPITWLLVIPANFIIDSLVLIAGMYIFKHENKKDTYKKTIIWVFLFGFLADFVGGIVLLITQFLGENEWVYEYLTGPLVFNPYDNIYSLIYTIFAVVVSGILIYIFNRYISFRKIEKKRTKRGLSLVLALLTAPYLFLVPTSTLHGYATQSFTNHIVYDSYIYAELFVADDLENDILAVENMDHFNHVLVSTFRESINNAKKTKVDNIGNIKYRIVFYRLGDNAKKMQPITIYQNGDNMYFEWKNKVYKLDNNDVQKIYSDFQSMKNNIE